MSSIQAFYQCLDADRFNASEYTRGPWSDEHQHAGPPCALLASRVEAALAGEPDLFVLRLTFEILRPVPITRLHTSTRPLHSGRTLKVIEASLLDDAGKPLIRARAVIVKARELQLPERTREEPALTSPEQARPYEFEFFNHNMGYHRGMELRQAAGQVGTGQAAVWMRMRVPLIAGEPVSALQRVVTAADSGNGVSYFLDPGEYSFMNPDLSVYLHRLPVGEWVCLDARTTAQASGVGLADTLLHDEQGEIGRSAQSLLILPG